MSQMTLKAGIEKVIVEAVPSIKGGESVDFPYYHLSIVDVLPNEAANDCIKEILAFQLGQDSLVLIISIVNEFSGRRL